MTHWTPKTTGTDFELPPILSRSSSTSSSDDRQRPAQQGRRERHAARDHRRHLARLRLAGDEPRSEGRHHHRPDRGAHHRPGHAAAVARAVDRGRCRSAIRPTAAATATRSAFRTPTQPLPMEYNPRKVFHQLFGQGDTADERAAITQETGSMLDASRATRSRCRVASARATRRWSATTSIGARDRAAGAEARRRRTRGGVDAARRAGRHPDGLRRAPRS